MTGSRTTANNCLIQTNDGFSLYNLAEIRFFLSKLGLNDSIFVINDERWEEAKRELINKYRHSTKLQICSNFIKDFEATIPNKKYKSDFEVFIRESKLEDFFNENGETIFVSTIHKAKGKEFDNVFLLIENVDISTSQAKRQLYVAMTRAKQNLTVHTNSNFLNNITAENIELVNDTQPYLPPDQIAIHLTYKDVVLHYFISKQNQISRLTSGDTLIIHGNTCLNSKRQFILKFSQQFIKKNNEMKEKNYELKSAKVNFVVYWLKEGAEQEIQIVLPELYFEKTQ